MANHKSSLKRIRQEEKRRLHNRYYAKTMRNTVKKLRATTDKAEAVAMYPGVQKMLDKLAKTNIIHKNKAKSIVDCPMWIPRSAFLNTMRHNKTTTPTMLFSFPNRMLKILTKKKQNAIVAAIFTRYTHI